MVNFRKRLGSGSAPKRENPIEIYENLDRKSETGPLRPAQEHILTQWWSQYKDQKDAVLKLHTGQGKTLIGLLISLSNINRNLGSSLYVCPNIYLVEQTCKEAEKFGIPYCRLEQNERSLPDDFLDGKKILIVHVQKVFNGKSIFLKDRRLNIASVILDDCHACVDSITNAFKITAKNSSELYKSLLNLFEDDLKEQGEGSYMEIKDGVKETLLPVPFWSWLSKKSDVLRILGKYREDNTVKYAWDLIKDEVRNCQCYFSGKKLEISTYLNPALNFPFLRSAKHLLAMSATTQNDAFLIKGLGMSTESISRPIVYPQEKWSGEKMLLLPSLIDVNLDRNSILTYVSNLHLEKCSYGVFAVVPSFKRAKEYEAQKACVINTENIADEIERVKSGVFSKTLVIVNRYDGIDLPDAACRILILDSCPYAESLTDQYEELCRSNSEIMMLRMAQKVEQGLGRSVRGEKDYSVILLIGEDLVKFIKSSSTQKHFSKQTQKQVEIGLKIVEFTKEEDSDSPPLDLLSSLINQCLTRDEGWKDFYREEMDKIQYSEESSSTLNSIFESERRAEEAYLKDDKPHEAAKIVQEIIDKEIAPGDSEEIGWYLQTIARYLYEKQTLKSEEFQSKAYKQNSYLLKPRHGFDYVRLPDSLNDQRNRRVNQWIQKFQSYEDLLLEVQSIKGNLSFGIGAEKFEKALQSLGLALGLTSERPDREKKVGPDNLWVLPGSHYILFECKSEVAETRSDITKSETGQMNNHCGWFLEKYGSDASVSFVMAIPTKDISSQGNFTHDVKILRRRGLRKLVDNFQAFFSEFKVYSLDDISDEKIHTLLSAHSLDVQSLKVAYFDTPYQKQALRS